MTYSFKSASFYSKRLLLLEEKTTVFVAKILQLHYKTNDFAVTVLRALQYREPSFSVSLPSVFSVRSASDSPFSLSEGPQTLRFLFLKCLRLSVFSFRSASDSPFSLSEILQTLRFLSPKCLRLSKMTAEEVATRVSSDKTTCLICQQAREKRGMTPYYSRHRYNKILLYETNYLHTRILSLSWTHGPMAHAKLSYWVK